MTNYTQTTVKRDNSDKEFWLVLGENIAYLQTRTWYETMLGLFNFIILQWFFIRLGYTVNTVSNAAVSWNIIYFVVPLTGWWGDYIPIGRMKMAEILE